MNGLHTVAFILLVVGGLNWGLELFGVGLDRWVGGIAGGLITQIVYALVALSAIYEIIAHKKICKECGSGQATMGM